MAGASDDKNTLPRSGFAWRELNHSHRVVDTVWRHQDDPELEQMRREVLRRNVLTLFWPLGVPLLIFGTIALFWPR
jgi:hypothetical protein